MIFLIYHPLLRPCLLGLILTISSLAPFQALGAMRSYPSSLAVIPYDSLPSLRLVRKWDQKSLLTYKPGDQISFRLKGSNKWLEGPLNAIETDHIQVEKAHIWTSAISHIRPIRSKKQKAYRAFLYISGTLSYGIGFGLLLLGFPSASLLIVGGILICILGIGLLTAANFMRRIYRIGWLFDLIAKVK